MPTSTPAFQMSAMYGVRPDIPGFHYYDRHRRGDIHFPRPGHAAWVEARQAAGRSGILDGGSAYGCVFTGGAENDLFSFARLSRPTGRGLVCALSAFVVVGWVAAKSLLQTVIELTRAVLRLIANPAGDQGWRWLTIQIAISVWVRGFFTLAVSRDLYAGVPAVYVDYDVAGHAFGPRSRRALRTLRRVDRALRQLVRVVRRVPEHRTTSMSSPITARRGARPSKTSRVAGVSNAGSSTNFSLRSGLASPRAAGQGSCGASSRAGRA